MHVDGWRMEEMLGGVGWMCKKKKVEWSGLCAFVFFFFFFFFFGRKKTLVLILIRKHCKHCVCFSLAVAGVLSHFTLFRCLTLGNWRRSTVLSFFLLVVTAISSSLLA